MVNFKILHIKAIIKYEKGKLFETKQLIKNAMIYSNEQITLISN